MYSHIPNRFRFERSSSFSSPAVNSRLNTHTYRQSLQRQHRQQPPYAHIQTTPARQLQLIEHAQPLSACCGLLSRAFKQLLCGIPLSLLLQTQQLPVLACATCHSTAVCSCCTAKGPGPRCTASRCLVARTKSLHTHLTAHCTLISRQQVYIRTTNKQALDHAQIRVEQSRQLRGPPTAWLSHLIYCETS